MPAAGRWKRPVHWGVLANRQKVMGRTLTWVQQGHSRNPSRRCRRSSRRRRCRWYWHRGHVRWIDDGYNAFSGWRRRGGRRWGLRRRPLLDALSMLVHLLCSLSFEYPSSFSAYFLLPLQRKQSGKSLDHRRNSLLAHFWSWRVPVDCYCLRREGWFAQTWLEEGKEREEEERGRKLKRSKRCTTASF